MIPVEELPQESVSTEVAPPVVVHNISGEDFSKVAFLDSELEELASRLGRKSIFDIILDLQFASLDVVSGIKRLWESGGWAVEVFHREEHKVQMVFAKAGHYVPKDAITRPVTAPVKRENLPSTATSRFPKMNHPLLVRMPTRGRPEQAISVLNQYRNLAHSPVIIEVVMDHDDPTMNRPEVLQRLIDLDCKLSIGIHRNKIEAVNGGDFDDWKILALVSDDMVPVIDGYDHIIIDEMNRYFPFFDGAIYFNDGYNRDNVKPNDPVLCTLPIMGRHLVDAFQGEIYNRAYGSLYSDDEQTRIYTAMNRIQFVDTLLIEHRHHAAGKAVFDALYEFNDNSYGAADKQTFERRQELKREKSQFFFDSPPMWLSILVCSTTARVKHLKRLEEYLRIQMRRYSRQVELCIAVDNGEMSIGDKRNQLLKQAVGHYVAFVDDDDWVAHDYVDRIINAVQSEPDCVHLHGIITTDGKSPEHFYHSVDHPTWYSQDGVHYRSPNHLSPVRRELALKAGFPSKNFGEDHDYSKALLPMLKVEANPGPEPLYYYLFQNKERMGT